ncbi:hypothetical protein HNI00_08545 [Thermoleptolyngbya oregonensis NK1-22]|uniref:Uncharacterized protein n=1 Tax=Thermoleptolyngbya oregonensis NK1-22 TaxID=2547457 RepID=A0AA96Y3K4_9CYAN|nr:hypothetical protein [Thermoleptolyngbya oregonensis]WOB43201.1 hypothetical protein HNI00_08545 [Thermoleptolyngbya oregonensis NK1-22]
MTERIPRSVHYTTLNLLKVLAAKGDPDAIAALQRSDEADIEIVDDDSEGEILIQVQDESSTYLITEHGVSRLDSTGDLLEAWGIKPEDLNHLQDEDPNMSDEA